LDDRKTDTKFVTARNQLKTTIHELDDRKTDTEFVTARNQLKTTIHELDDRKTDTEFVTTRNQLKTTIHELDDRKTDTEFVTARNQLKTTIHELDDRKTGTKFVTARILPKTTNNKLDDTTTLMEFVVAGNLLQTIVYGLHVGKAQPTYASAWNLLKTTTSVSSDSTTDTTYLTPRDVLQRSTESLKGSTTKPKLVTSRDVLHTVTANVTDITEGKRFDIRVTPFEEPSGGLTVCEEAACEGTKTQLEETTSSPGGTTSPLKTADTTEPLFECSSCLVQSATQSLSDLTQVSSPVSRDTIATSPDDLANQSLVLTTASSTEPTAYTDHDTIIEVKSDAKCVTNCNVSIQAMPVTEESLSNVNNASSATLDNDADIFGQSTEHSQTLYNSTSADIFGQSTEHSQTLYNSTSTNIFGQSTEHSQTLYNSISADIFGQSTEHSQTLYNSTSADIFGQPTEHSQTLYNSTSADIFEIMEQMLNSTILPAELLTLQILYELLLSKYELAHVSDDMKTPGGTYTTHRVPHNEVSSEILNTVKVLELIPGIMDERILDNITDEELNGLREAVEYVWSVVENEAGMDIDRSLVKTNQGADRSVNHSTPSLMPEINRNKSKRQTTDGILGQEAEVHESAGSPLGFMIRNFSYSDQKRLEGKISSLVTGNVIAAHSPQNTRNSHEVGNL
jgi:molybdopterin-binding protein